VKDWQPDGHVTVSNSDCRTDIRAGDSCSVRSDRSADPVPDTGDYIYAPGDGQVTASRDMRVIKRDAIS
jgi:hypothetical protein